MPGFFSEYIPRWGSPEERIFIFNDGVPSSAFSQALMVALKATKSWSSPGTTKSNV